MKVLVTGATGFVGHEIVKQLHAAGHAPRLLVRNPLSPKVRGLVPRYATEIHSGDVLEANSLKPALEGCDAVIHLVGIISEVGRQTFERVHTEATQNLVAAAQRSGFKRLIHMSALGTCAEARSRYHQSKWAAEQAVRDSGLDWTIFRPSIIYGPGDGFVNLFAQVSKFSPVIPLIGGGKTRFQPIHVGDVAHCFVRALSEPRSTKQTYDLCGTEVLSLAEIVDAILQITGRRRIKLPLPFSLTHTLAGCAEFLFNRLLGQSPPLNRDQVLMLRSDNVGNGIEAIRLFELTPVSFHKLVASHLS